MRIIFFILLLSNFGFLLYNLFSKPQEVTKTNDKNQNIVLYSESNADHSIEKKIDKNLNKEIEKAVKPDGNVEKSIDLTINEEDKGIEQLFSEVNSQSDSIIKSQTQQHDQNHDTEFNCYTLGPTLHPKKLQVLKDKIRDQYGAAFFNEYEEKGTTYYRIYIPPFENLSDIRIAQKILAENNLGDHYVMNQEGKKNAIALGVFRIKKITDDIAEKVKSLGYQVVIEPILEEDKVQFFLKIHTSKPYPIIKLDQQELDTDLEIEACKKS